MRRISFIVLVLTFCGFVRAQAQDTLSNAPTHGGYRSFSPTRTVSTFPQIKLTRVMQIGGGVIMGISPLLINKVYIPSGTDGKVVYDYSNFNKAMAIGAGTTLLGFLAEVFFTRDTPGFANSAFTTRAKRGFSFGMQSHGVGMSINF